MKWYFYIALVAIVSQVIFLIYALRNYRYVLKHARKKRWWYQPKTVLIVPCKGIDAAFETNVTSFFRQDYDNFLLWFVVADKQDPAYEKLQQLKDKLIKDTKAQDVKILVAGTGKSCSQKLHNLLHCYRQLTDDIEIMAFADSDACIRPNWLIHIVYPLRNKRYGASSGYRWFVPEKNNSASLAISALNAKVAQLLGNTRFNQAWGGSMAIRVDTFRQIGLEKIWSNVVSDDLTLTCAVKKSGEKLAFVPACLVASYDSFTWAKLFEFGRRQFLITRIYAPKVWWFALLSNIYSVAGLWATLALAIYASAANVRNVLFFWSVPIVFFISQVLRALLRQKMIGRLLEKDWQKMKYACFVDIAGSWLWSLLMLLIIAASAFGSTISWRDIKYKLKSPTETIILTD